MSDPALRRLLALFRWLTLLALAAWGGACAACRPDAAEGLFDTSARRLAEAKPSPAPVVLLLGDSGSASPEFRANLEAMAREPALLALHAGDVTYRTPREYGRFVRAARALPFPLFAVAGDHDRDLDPALETYERVVGGRNRVVEGGGVRVVLLDSSGETLEEPVLRFLEESLRKGPRPRWSIVVTHCPPYQPGLPFPKSLGKGHALRDAAAARRLLDVCRAEKVALLACGHIHGFRRADEGGVPLVISGGGGKDVEPGDAFHYARVTLGATLGVEEVRTTPAEGREPLVRLLDAGIALFARSGPWIWGGLFLPYFLLTCVSMVRRRRAALDAGKA